MLKMKADIRLFMPGETKHALILDVDTALTLRADINLDGYLTAGTISADKNDKKHMRGQTYKVLIEMPFIFGEAYEAVKSSLINGNEFFIQNGSRKVGTGRIISFVYNEEKE